ncbi:A-kinase anchor protein 1, mitochondrial-like isoform X1 [Dermacentor albipictus]|uniref:A-kinase anchor protein 1, mitochondrial-like isoform X1 n=2 Tax=Dermacentor albipictus TaxID=60249 RepID=UPI0031FC8D63
MAGLGPRAAAVTLPAAAALALLLSFFLLKRRRSRSSNSECRSLSETTACLLGSDDQEDDDEEQDDVAGRHSPLAISSRSDQVLRSPPEPPSPPPVAESPPDMRLRDGSKVGDAKLKGGPRCSPAMAATTTKTGGGSTKPPCSNSGSKASGCNAAASQPARRQQQNSVDVVVSAASTAAVREQPSSPPCAVLTVEIPEQQTAPVQRPEHGSPVVGRDALCGASPSGSVDSLLGQSSPSPPSSTVSPVRRESGSEPNSSLAQDVAALSLAEQPADGAANSTTQGEAAADVIASAVATTTTTAAPPALPAEPATRQDDDDASSPGAVQNEESVSEDKSQAQALSFSDAHSEGSSDSGKGGSDIHGGSEAAGGAGNLSPEEELSRTYEFELPRELCGRFIGQGGRNVTAIKSRSNTRIYVQQHPFSSKLKICSIQGTTEEIRTALELIRKKFPPHAYPNLTLVQVNAEPMHYPGTITLPETLQLRLPDAVTCDVVLTSLVTAGHFFLQQPTHPTYPSLARLDQCMLACYGQGLDTPPLPHPVEAGIICAAQVCGGWFRALVVGPSDENEECDIKFLDYGGYMTLSTSLLRQIRSDFMMLPFQASECYLANVQPVEDDNVWSAEACATFEDLAQGQILQALIVGYADNGIPLVHLYRVQGVSSVFINRELVNRGVARWLEHPL